MTSSYSDNDIVIVAGYRTPIGKLNGCFSALKASDLGAAVIRKLLESTQLIGEDISEVIIGQVLTAGNCVIMYVYRFLKIIYQLTF